MPWSACSPPARGRRCRAEWPREKPRGAGVGASGRLTGMTVSVPAGCRVWVLLEGASDVAAVRVVAERAGIALAERGVELVDMHGATNIHRHLLAATASADRPHVLGMCDAPEAPFFVRALRRIGCDVDGVEDLPAWGFQVCHRDLEDELIRDRGEA